MNKFRLILIIELLLLSSLTLIKGNQQFSFSINEYNPENSPDGLTCDDFGISSPSCSLNFHICLGSTDFNGTKFGCEILETDETVITQTSTVNVGQLISVKDKLLNKLQENVGIQLDVIDIQQDRKILFTYRTHFQPKKESIGILEIEGIALKLEYAFIPYCTKNYYGKNCDIFCTKTDTYKCDSNGTAVCTMMCLTNEKCIWNQDQEQFHCQCDPNKSDCKDTEKECDENFCKFGIKMCSVRKQMCQCFDQKSTLSACLFKKPKTTNVPKEVTYEPSTEVPMPAATSRSSSNNAIIVILVLFGILIIILSIIFGSKMSKARRVSRKFKYGPMRNSSRNIANDLEEEANIPPPALVEYIPSVTEDYEDADPIIKS